MEPNSYSRATLDRLFRVHDIWSIGAEFQIMVPPGATLKLNSKNFAIKRLEELEALDASQFFLFAITTLEYSDAVGKGDTCVVSFYDPRDRDFREWMEGSHMK